MKHDSEALTIRLYELLLLVLAALCVGLGVYSHIVTPAVPDALGLRIGLAVISLIAAGALYVAPFLWRHAGPITYSVLTLHSVLSLYFLFVSQLATAQTLGLVVVMVLTAISLHDVRWMLGYSALAGLTAIVISFLADVSSVNPILVVMVVVAVPAIGFIAVQSRRILEEELLDTIAESKVAVKAKTEFLATMSHEIRTPMNGVLGMATLLGDTDLNDTQRDYVDTIRLSGDTLLTIINDILDFSKIEADRIELEETPFELRSMVEEALDLLGTKAYEKSVDLAYHIDDDVPPALLGDVTRLRQVIVNLIGNAIKFTDEGEVLLSITKRRTVGGEHEVLFAVRDTGIGIPASRIDRLFSSFSQVDSSHTRKYGGTGLGLAISKRLAELMGGAMWVESEVGIGSTFSFTILARTSASIKSAALQGKQAVLEGKRVLIVEDGALSRKTLAKQLRTWGAVVTAAPSGRDAIRFLREGGRFEVAVLDMQLPDMEGAALARSLYEHGPMPLVGLTAPGRPVQTDGLFVAALSKPVKQASLYNGFLAALGPSDQVAVADAISEDGIWIQRDQAPASADTIQQALATPAAPILPSLRILLAEDNAVNQKVALRILERLGYDAVLAADGREVVKAFETTSYDVVLMDVQMPEMDGLQATAHLRAHLPPERQPRIIAMTANAMEGDRERCLAAGMDDYLPKPVKREALTQALLVCEPLSALKFDAAPLGASHHIPIRSAPKLELPAFARTESVAARLPEIEAEAKLAEPREPAEPTQAPPTDTAQVPVSPPAQPPAAPPRQDPEEEVPTPPHTEPTEAEPARRALRNPFRTTTPSTSTSEADTDSPPPPQAPLDTDALFPMPEAPAFSKPSASSPPPALTEPPAPALSGWASATKHGPASSNEDESQPGVPHARVPNAVESDAARSHERGTPTGDTPTEDASDVPSAPDAAWVDALDTAMPPVLGDAAVPPPFAEQSAEEPGSPEDQRDLRPADAFLDVSDLITDPTFSFPTFDAPPSQPPSRGAPPPSRTASSRPDTTPTPVEAVVEAVGTPMEGLPTPEVILDHLREISGVDDPEFAREVLSGYLRADLGLIGTVVEGIRTRSYSEVTAASHKLKSSAATLGAEAFSELCARIETESRQDRYAGDIGEVARQFEDRAFAFRDVVQATVERLG